MIQHNPLREPPLNERGFRGGPHLYPRLLHRIANLIDAIGAVADEDPRRVESPHFVAGNPLPIYNEEAVTDDDDVAGLVGWVVQEDGNCWAFIPYVEGTPLEPAV